MRNFVSYALGLALTAASAVSGTGGAASALPIGAATIAAVASAAAQDAAASRDLIAVRHRSHAPSPTTGTASPTYVWPNNSSSGSPFGSPFGSQYGGAPGYRYGSSSGGTRTNSQQSGSAHQYQFPQ
jgi:hypothetical protein